MKNIQTQKGFSLVEIVFVVVIIGLMGVFAVTSYNKWLPNMRLKAAARDLYSSIQKTRLEAIKRNQNIAIVFDTLNETYVICLTPGPDLLWHTLADNTTLLTEDFDRYQSGIKYGIGDIVGNNSMDNPQVALPADNVSYDFSASNDNVLVFGPTGTMVFAPAGISNEGYVYLQNENNTVFGVGTKTSGVCIMRRWRGGSWK